jgi:hypothetical protein
MPSASQKGSYYKSRTKKWLESMGYSVGHLERMLVVRGKPGLFVKRDQFGSDLLAVSATQVLFVQVKMGGATWRKRGLSSARIEFAPFPVPPNSVQMIVVWEPRARQPLTWLRRHCAEWEEADLVLKE